MLEQVLPANLFAALLIFARVGSAMMLLPGFGEVYVLQRYRLLLALAIALLLTPVLGPALPALPGSAPRLVALIGGEAVVGLFLGTVARVLLSALDVAGTLVSLQLGLSAAQIFNPMLAQQGTLTSAFYGVLGVLLIFVTDLHHLLLNAVVDSYNVFIPGSLPPLGDLSEAMVRVAASAFQLGLEMAAPFIVLGTLFFVALGVVGRLVPQLQLLFVMQPLQIMGGFAALIVVLGAGMRWFLETYAQQFTALIGG
ncbi:MAG TPA: flagellar biosynthetic protein FliR [Stellaceae bacterium]|nr:flagellar biosynthetic protein FliR [Stellaceae bacterium]